MRQHHGPIAHVTWGQLQIDLHDDYRMTLLPWRAKQRDAALRTPFVSLECLDEALVRVEVTPDGRYLATCFDFPLFCWLSNKDAYDAAICLMVNIEEFVVAWNARMRLNHHDPGGAQRFDDWAQERLGAVEKARGQLPPPPSDSFRRRMLQLEPTPEERARLEKEG